VNAAIAECLAELNDRRVLRQFGKKGRQLFDEVDVPDLKPLPSELWVHAEWRRCRVGLDNHNAIERHNYAVPRCFARRGVEARFTASKVEIFAGGERIAVHMRGSGNGRHTTIPKHMPSSHRRYGEWTPAKIREEAGRNGPMLSVLVEKVIDAKTPTRTGLLVLSRYHQARETLFSPAARRRGAARAGIQARNHPPVKSILEKGSIRCRFPNPPSKRRSSTPSAIRAITTEGARMLKHSALDLLGQLGLAGMAKAFAEMESTMTQAVSATQNGWRCCSTIRRPTEMTDASFCACDMPSCGTPACLRMLIIGPSVILIEGFLRRCSPVTGYRGTRTWPSSPRSASEKLVGLCDRPYGLPRHRSAFYTRLPRLIDELTLAKVNGRIAACMKSLAKVELLILDDWGLQALDGNARHHLPEILGDRYGQRPTLVTSQLPVARWHQTINDPIYADAILNRLVHNAHRREIEGESLRGPAMQTAA